MNNLLVCVTVALLLQMVSMLFMVNFEESEKGENTMKKTMIIDGMMCPHCSGRVTQVLNAIEGVTAEVVLEDKAAYLTLSGEVADEVFSQKILGDGVAVCS